MTTTQALIDPACLTRPPAEVLNAVARTEIVGVLRRRGVPVDMIPDALQEVVISAYLAIHRNGHALPPPADDEPPSSKVRDFLAGIARRRGTDIMRRRRVRREVPAGLAADVHGIDAAAPAQFAPDYCAENGQRAEILRSILEQMPRPQADVLVLSAILGMTAGEIAEQLGIEEPTVKSRLARACARARRAIQNLPGERRRLVERSPLMALFLGDVTEERPAQPKRFAVVAGILGLAAGLAGHVGLSSLAPEPAPAITAEERATAATAGESLCPPATQQAAAAVSPVPSAPPALARQAPALGDTLAAERVLLRSAEDALTNGQILLARGHLMTHEERYPGGKLVGLRERLSARARGTTSPSQ